MNAIIEETMEIETLSIVGPKSGVEYTSEFIGNTGAFTDGQFVWSEVHDCYMCDQATFDWWSKVINDHQGLNNRIDKLSHQYGREAVFDAIRDIACHVLHLV